MTEPSLDAFTAVTSLIALIADPKAAGKRLDEFQKQIDAVSKAQERLAADRQQHDRVRAELEAREQRVREREAVVAAREGRQAHYDKAVDRWKREHDFPDSDIQPASSLRREPYHA
jgi:hypothetical protein